MVDILKEQFQALGLAPIVADIAAHGILLLAVLVLSLIAGLIARRITIKLITSYAKKTSSKWDDIIVKKGVFHRLTDYAPSVVSYLLLSQVFPADSPVLMIAQRIILVYMIAVSMMVLNKLLRAITAIYQTYEIARSKPIKGYLQIVSIFIYITGLTLMVTTLLNTSPLALLSGIGALSAVILLVFKDSILGLVSSIQLAANNLVRIGDWVEVPQSGADGNIIDINLQSVKVQNWDKTIVTFPISTLTNAGFKNWRGMSESGGRRIKRSLAIDMHSIRFLSNEELDALEQVTLIQNYIQQKRQEIAPAPQPATPQATTSGGTGSELLLPKLNNRQLTNVGTFRAYIVAYLKAHPLIHNNMTFLVRQLSPGPHGLPLEIYVFSNQQDWGIYEDIQADIFDHLLSVLPAFSLKLYQRL